MICISACAVHPGTRAKTNELAVGAVERSTPPPAGAGQSASVADIVPVIFVSI